MSQVQVLFFGRALKCCKYPTFQACETRPNTFQTILVIDTIFSDRHHFDNPVYSTSYRGGHPGHGGPGAPPSGSNNPVQSTHLPLNNGCSRVVNHFSTSASSCSNTAKKHVNIERDKLGVGGGQGACGGPNTSVPNHYQDDTEEEMEHESGNFAQCICSSYKWL